jgi:hypothetical protein
LKWSVRRFATIPVTAARWACLNLTISKALTDLHHNICKGQTDQITKTVLPTVPYGTLSHASDVLKNGDPEILRALCNGEIKIDRAWRWSKQSKMSQRESLRLYRRNRGMEKVAQKLIARQLRKLKSERSSAHRWKSITPNEAVKGLGFLPPQALESIDVIFIKTPVPILALSEEIGQQLGFREEAPPCESKSPSGR